MRLRCPTCKSEQLATVEDLSGAAYGTAEIGADGERQFIHEGYTEVFWDSSETRGIECRDCGWQCTDGDYMEQLVAE